MASRFRVSSTIPRRLSELGLATAEVLREAGLAPTLFEQERPTVTTAELFAFYRALERLADEPTIGLQLGTVSRVEHYDPIAIAALYARSLRDALDRMARYKQLTCPEAIHITERAGECRVEFEWLLADDEAEPSVLIDCCFAWVADIAARGSGSRIRPARIELRRAKVNRALYQRHFGCAVKLGAKRDALMFDLADLERPFITHNADVLAMVAPQLEAELARQRAARSYRDQVKAALKQRLAGQRPELSSIARDLGVSTRTLQRRLGDEDVTFQQLVSEARRELARHYLRHSSLELVETAYLLGYEDANSFFRAFQQWEGTSPGVFRARTR